MAFGRLDGVPPALRCVACWLQGGHRPRRQWEGHGWEGPAGAPTDPRLRRPVTTGGQVGPEETLMVPPVQEHGLGSPSAGTNQRARVPLGEDFLDPLCATDRPSTSGKVCKRTVPPLLHGAGAPRGRGLSGRPQLPPSPDGYLLALQM